MEMGGGGWSWVEVGARFSNTHSENRFPEFSYFMKGFKKYIMNISR